MPIAFKTYYRLLTFIKKKKKKKSSKKDYRSLTMFIRTGDQRLQNRNKIPEFCTTDRHGLYDRIAHKVESE